MITRIYRFLKRIADLLDRYSEKLLIILMISMFITVLIQIFYRYIVIRFTRISLPYTEELARYLLIWISYLGVAVGLNEGIHVSFDLLYDKLNISGKRFLYIVERLLMLFFILTILIAGRDLLVRLSSNVSPAMRIPIIWAYAAPWIGSWLIMVRLIVQLWGSIFYCDEYKVIFITDSTTPSSISRIIKRST